MIGIVILNYNSWSDSAECISSILDGETKTEYRIYLVDNASPEQPEPEQIRFLEKSDVCLIQNKENKGYSAGNNVGIKAALDDGCSAVLISNSDVRYEKGSIAKMEAFLMEHPEAGIVGPKIILGNGQIQKECMMFKTGSKEKYLLRTRLHILFPRYNSRYWGREHDYEKEIFQVYAVMGCCFMMSRNCALDVTPLDENTFLYEEELILGIQMEKSGWKTFYYPESVIHHLHGKTTEKVKAFAYTCNVCSEIYYCRKYLGMRRWQIWPLIWYRSGIYFLKSIRLADFRNEKKKYISDICRNLSRK